MDIKQRVLVIVAPVDQADPAVRNRLSTVIAEQSKLHGTFIKGMVARGGSATIALDPMFDPSVAGAIVDALKTAGFEATIER